MDRQLSVAIAIAGIVLSSCSRIAEHAFAQPTIGVRSVKLKSVGLSGGSIELALAIANPNPYPLPVQHAVYSFALRDSTEVGHGESPVAFTVPAHDSTVVELPVDVSWQGLRAAARDASRDGTVDYVLKGCHAGNADRQPEHPVPDERALHAAALARSITQLTARRS